MQSKSPEFDAEKLRCPKCGRKWLGGGILEESKQGKDKDKDKQDQEKQKEMTLSDMEKEAFKARMALDSTKL